jgi:phosphoribosylanthranilate isomerase
MSVDDALSAAELGADAVGLIFADSPRQVTAEQARRIVRRLPPFVTVTGVFVDEDIRVVEKLHREIGFHIAQLHGNEDQAYLARLELPLLKSFAVKDAGVLDRIEEYRVRAFLLDTYRPDRAGGTGEVFDWSIAIKAKAYGQVVLSGGLTPENVTGGLSAVRPWAVDVSSGIEAEPGVKDRGKMKAFIEKVHQWDSQTG